MITARKNPRLELADFRPCDFDKAAHERVVAAVENTADNHNDANHCELGIRKPFRKGDERQKVRVDQLISHISADTAHRVAPQITFA